jgi:hypothetical protein
MKTDERHEARISDTKFSTIPAHTHDSSLVKKIAPEADD